VGQRLASSATLADLHAWIDHLGLIDQGSRIRAPLEQLIDLLQSFPGTSEVAEGEADAGKFDRV
jgi:hypothetical protein